MNKITFEKNIVTEIAPGGGKTYTLSQTCINHLINNSNDVVIASTMSNKLLDNLLKEIITQANKLIHLVNNKNFSQSKQILIDILNKQNVYTNCLKLGILLVNKHYSFDKECLKDVKVILTNHSYFFPQGHQHFTNRRFVEIDNYCILNNKSIKIYYDEFDQYHKFGNDSIQLNDYCGNNHTNKQFVQPEKVLSCFQYCQLAELKENNKNVNYKTGKDFTYLLPTINYNYEFKTNKWMSKEYRLTLINNNNNFNFKTNIIDNLKTVKTMTDYSKLKPSKYDNYYIKKVDVIKQCKCIDELHNIDFANLNEHEQLLYMSDSLLLTEQQLAVYENILVDGKNEVGKQIKLFETNLDFTSWAKNNLKKNTYVRFVTHCIVNWTDLYKKYLIVYKKEYVFKNCERYYMTATTANLPKMGYKVNDTNKYCKNSSNKIVEIDIFTVQNKQATIHDISIFTKLLKDVNFHTLAITNKKVSCEMFFNENAENENVNNCEVYVNNVVMNVGKNIEKKEVLNKNILISYQHSTITQGTNMKDTTLMIQDCHVKTSVLDRCIKIGNEFFIEDYYESVTKTLIQSLNRINRGNIKYKSIINLLDFNNSDEVEIIKNIINEFKKYGYKINLFEVNLELDRQNKKKDIYKRIVKHINSKNECINLNTIEDSEINIFKIENKEDKHKEIYDFYLELKESSLKDGKKIKDNELLPYVLDTYGISLRTFKNIKSKFINL